MSQNLKGTLILTLTAVIWGSAFVAQAAGADAVGPFTFNASRNIMAALFLVLLITWRHTGTSPFAYGTAVTNFKAHWLPGIYLGLVLFAGEALQQGGISLYPAHVASAGRSGFLTSLYVVIVAVVSWLMGRTRSWLIALAVILSLAGLYLLCFAHGLHGLYWADLLSFACAFSYAAHIIVIDRYLGYDSLYLSLIQFITAGLSAGVMMLIFEPVTLANWLHALVPMMYAGIMSSGIAYTLQIIGQKYAEPVSAALAMSLEAVFASLLGWVILHQGLSGHELFGAALVFSAVILAQLPDLIQTKQLK